MDNLKKTIADTFLELADGLETGSLNKAKIALVGIGSEHGEENTMAGAVAAAKKGIHVTFIGSIKAPEDVKNVECVYADCQDDAFKIMEDLLKAGKVDGAVSMHYPFPIGVSTVGRSIAPANGKKFYLATTTGTSSTDRVEGMILNAISGIATAKACGVKKPSVGILNLDGGRQVQIALESLKKQGYDINFAESARSDGGCILRGNDVLLGSADVIVCDTLTGNVLCKMLSAANSGGRYETLGDGYGPGIGRSYDQLVLIVSRASGAALIANAIEYAAELVQGKVLDVVEAEFKAAKKAGLNELLDARKAKDNAPSEEEEVQAPPKEVVTGEILGVDVMDLNDASKALWKAGIYAEEGMGCTGPVIRVNDAKVEAARKVLADANFISL